MQRLRPVLFIVVAVLSTTLALIAYGVDAFRRLELDTVDARFSVRGETAPPKDIVIVDVDEATFEKLRLQWPFPRSVHGQVIDRIQKDGARAIAYDIQFSEPTTLQGLVERARAHQSLLREIAADEDDALVTAIVRAKGRVVLATTGAPVFQADPKTLRHVTGSRAANSSVPNDPGAVLRRLPYAVAGLQSFAVATVEVASGRQVSRDGFDDGSAWIDYHGPPNTIATVPFWRVARGLTKRGLFRDKIVVVGPSVSNLQDVHPTPMSRDEGMSGAEVQANAISTVRRGVPLKSSPVPLDVALILLLGLAVPLASLRLSLPWVFAIALGLGPVFLLVGQLAFDSGLILPLIYPLGALVIGAVGTLVVHYVTAAFEREHIRDVFSRFVPEQVVDEALDCAGEDLRLPAVRRQCTVMFADLRGFTSWAEPLRPERVVEVLNRYLGEMSGAILDNGGTLVAYMGDGIMAVFGAPLEQPDHADRALAAAREMLNRLEPFNEWIRGEGIGEGFRIGIGVNSGTVMSGNIGSARRMEYTAIGDTTNAAARLEQMTKETPYQVLVSDSTRAMLRGDAPDLTYVDAVPVRGKVVKANLWALADQPSPFKAQSPDDSGEVVDGRSPPQSDSTAQGARRGNG